jgi:hypothetical protein
MENEHWQDIRKWISVRSAVPEIVIDYISVSNILKLCVNGLSNYKIAYFNDTTEEYVASILYRYFGFKGWDFDLDLNPWRIYKTTLGNYELYQMKIWDLTNLLDCDIIQISYKLCKKYETIREEIEQYD